MKEDRDNVIGIPLPYQSQEITLGLWLSKGRAHWFGSHDVDEYVVPNADNGDLAAGRRGHSSWPKESQGSIAKVLQALPLERQETYTRMWAVRIPDDDDRKTTTLEKRKIYLASAEADPISMRDPYNESVLNT